MSWFRRKPKSRWIEMSGHDIEPGPGGVIHFSTCWCKKVDPRITTTVTGTLGINPKLKPSGPMGQFASDNEFGEGFPWHIHGGLIGPSPSYHCPTDCTASTPNTGCSCNKQRNVSGCILKKYMGGPDE